MRGHYSSQTRKLNKHLQSGNGIKFTISEENNRIALMNVISIIFPRNIDLKGTMEVTIDISDSSSSDIIQNYTMGNNNNNWYLSSNSPCIVFVPNSTGGIYDHYYVNAKKDINNLYDFENLMTQNTIEFSYNSNRTYDNFTMECEQITDTPKKIKFILKNKTGGDLQTLYGTNKFKYMAVYFRATQADSLSTAKLNVEYKS